MSRLLAAFIYRWRLPLSAFIFLGALLSIPRANITDIDNDITAWFSKQDPVYVDYERFRTEFGGTRSLIVALQADSAERLFSDETLRFIDDVTGDVERVETVQRVSSLATATVVQATSDGGLDVRPLLDALDRGGAAEVRKRAFADDLIRGDLVSDDGTTTALIITFDEDRIDEVRSGVIQQIHELVDPQLPSGVRAYYNGSLEISETYNRVTLDNQQKFIPPILFFTVVAIYVTFRSWRKTLLAMIAVGVSVLWTLGLYSLMGFTYNVLASMLVPLIVVLAIADDVHIMQHWDEERRRAERERNGAGRTSPRSEASLAGCRGPRQSINETAFKATVAHLAAPLLGASATTALGMLSLATSNVVAVRAFGIGSAVGIMVDFAISLVLMPTLLTWVKPELHEAPHERYLIAPLQRIARYSCAYPKRVLVWSLVIGGVAALGMVRLHVDTNHINFFAKTHPLSQSASVIDQELSGVYSFQIMLEGAPESLKTPENLKRMDALANQLRAFPFVKKVTSVADYVKRINKELHDGDPAASVIPDSGDTIAQELFVFALGGEGRHELERVVASDYSRAQMSIKLASMSSDVVLKQVEHADAVAKQVFDGTGVTVLTTGSGRLFSTLDHYLVMSQLSSFGTAFVTVFGVIFVVFRSARFGVLTIAPNVLPVLAVLGVMGYLGISMNVATVMVASVALGVVDDDTIHFINRYRREVAAGASTDAAIELATAHEGRASLTTAFINSCGYAVLLMSEYRPTAWFGGLLALTMAVAFLAEVFILPATIKLLPRFFSAPALRGPKGGWHLSAKVPATLMAIFVPVAVSAQSYSGYVSVFGDYFPNRNDTAELRSRVFAEAVLDPTPKLLITGSGFAEGLIARRDSNRKDAIFRVQELTVEYKTDRLDVFAGFGTVAWGRLDEVQPTDVINPLDVSRYLFEGRGEARMPVGLARARLFLSENASIEGVYVPFFRRGRFDQLDEPTSPFNIAAPPLAPPTLGPTLTIPFVVSEAPPARTFGNAQGGARLNMTTGRVDWSLAAYDGFEPLGMYERGTLSPTAPVFPVNVVYPRFTMLGGDFETVSGKWGLRGELAAFVRDNFQAPALRIVQGSSLEAGVGVDRKAGDYRFSATALFHHESYDEPIDDDEGRTDVSLVFSSDRSFARERYQLRAFTVYNPSEGSAFLRAIATWKVRDNVAIEGSGGWFAGDGRDLTGRFADSDFVYARLKYYF